MDSGPVIHAPSFMLTQLVLQQAQSPQLCLRRAAGEQEIHLNAMSFAIHLKAMRRSWRCNPLECDRRSWRCIVGQSLTNYVVSGHAWQDNMYMHAYDMFSRRAKPFA